MSHEKSDFPNCSGPDKLASHRLHGTDAIPDQTASVEPIDGGCANQLYQGIALDPAKAPFDFRIRDFSPKLEAWIQHEPSGPCPYVDGQNLYAAPVDDPRQPDQPAGRVEIRAGELTLCDGQHDRL